MCELGITHMNTETKTKHKRYDEAFKKSAVECARDGRTPTMPDARATILKTRPKKSRDRLSALLFSPRASGPSATPGLPQLRAVGHGFCARLPSVARRQRAGQDEHPRSDLSHGHAALISRRRRRADDPARPARLFRRWQRHRPGRA